MHTVLRLILMLAFCIMVMILYQSINLFTNYEIKQPTLTLSPPSPLGSKVIHQEVTLSEKNNINTRSDFQKAQIESYCRLMGVTHSKVTETRGWTSLYQHLVYSDHIHTILCNIENTGCADLKHLVNTGSEGHLFSNSSLTSEAKRSKLKEYRKYMFVRNPLERLVHSYITSIQDPMINLTNTRLSHLKWEIFEHYRPIVYHHWIETGGGYEIYITFSEFIEYYLNEMQDKVLIDVRPLTVMCQPCLVRYDFYDDFYNCSQDIFKVFNPDKNKQANKNKQASFEMPTKQTLLEDYYRRLTFIQRARLYDAMRDELLFYYHLYPRARYSHVTLLGIEEELYRVNST